MNDEAHLYVEEWRDIYVSGHYHVRGLSMNPLKEVVYKINGDPFVSEASSDSSLLWNSEVVSLWLFSPDHLMSKFMQGCTQNSQIVFLFCLIVC